MPSNDLPAAMAALREAWAEMRTMAGRLESVVEGGGEPAAGAALRGLLDELWAGHERALRAIAIEDREELSARKVEVSLAHFPKGEFETRGEEVLQLGAASAEARQKAAIAALEVLATLEAATPEQIDSWTPEERIGYFEWITRMRGEREGHHWM